MNAHRYLGGVLLWEVDREVKYFNGVVMGKYRENDPETMKILNEQVSKEALYDEVSIYLQNKIYEYKQQDELDILQKVMFIEEQNEYEFLRANGIEMWVTKDDKNIIFEELCEDFTNYEDVVVTQVIHLEYHLEGTAAYITHLDHEYIFYSLEEYEQRLRNNLQKGNAATRMKSFKINHSKIPFTYEVEVQRKNENGENLLIERVQILSYILETYFKHKDLLKEYFQTN